MNGQWEKAISPHRRRGDAGTDERRGMHEKAGVGSGDGRLKNHDFCRGWSRGKKKRIKWIARQGRLRESMGRLSVWQKRKEEGAKP